MYIIYQEYELKRVSYKRELIDLYVFQKSPHSMLYSGDIAKYVTVPQSRLDNLCTPLLYFTGSGQNALSLC